MRLVITGAPRAGKTTYAHLLKEAGRRNGELLQLWHTDALAPLLGWSEQSDVVCRWLDLPAGWIIDGCAATRALRKWLAAPEHRTGRPCDAVIRMVVPHVKLTPGQATLAKGEATIWAQIEAPLRTRGVLIYDKSTT